MSGEMSLAIGQKINCPMRRITHSAMHVVRTATQRCRIALVLGAAASVTLAATVGAQSAAPLPSTSVYALAGTWTERSGASQTLASLRGEPVVLALVYLSCSMSCPLVTSDMLAVQTALRAAGPSNTRFVMITFDPSRDSLAALQAHASSRGLDAQWSLLRGSPADVRRIAVALGVSYRRLPSGDFDHSNIITVLDRDGVAVHQEVRLPVNRERLAAAVRAAGEIGRR